MTILTSLQPDMHILAGKKQPPAEIFIDVAYGADPKQTMDIYLPENRSIDSTKSLILLHGGGWNSGNKSDFNSYIDSFRKRMPHYAFFNINYRLFNGGNRFPAQEEDVKAALEFITNKSTQYQINKELFVLLGASAGAHLALLQAYKYDEPKIAAVVDFFGPTELTVMYNEPWHPYVNVALQMITGTTPVANLDIYYQSSPVNFIRSSSAPTLILHGAKDQVVDVSQSRLLQKKLEEAGVSNELVVYPAQRHGWHGATLSNSFDRITAFLQENVK